MRRRRRPESVPQLKPGLPRLRYFMIQTMVRLTESWPWRILAPLEKVPPGFPIYKSFSQQAGAPGRAAPQKYQVRHDKKTMPRGEASCTLKAPGIFHGVSAARRPGIPPFTTRNAPTCPWAGQAGAARVTSEYRSASAPSQDFTGNPFPATDRAVLFFSGAA